MNHKSNLHPLIKAILKILALAFLTLLVVRTIFITIDGLNDKVYHSDVGLVFGNEVKSNGELSNRLKARLDKAIELYNAQEFPVVIVSGGIDQCNNDEAEVMKAYLVENNIPAENIFVDSKGDNTAATVFNTVEIMQTHKMDSVLAISQFYHIARIKLAFKKLGIKNISSAHANYYELRDIYSLLREFFAYYKYALTPSP